MTVNELIDALTALDNKDRDISVHVQGTLSGIIEVVGIDDKDGFDEPNSTTVYLNAGESK